jgi:hypothetical protein
VRLQSRLLRAYPSVDRTHGWIELLKLSKIRFEIRIPAHDFQGAAPSVRAFVQPPLAREIAAENPTPLTRID